MAKGTITVHTENIFPIIKKWLYSDKDIFLREMVSNACDAVTKLKKVALKGEFTLPEGEAYEIHVVLDKKAKTLTISDNGIGMTGEEIEKYITQVAFSGAEEFLENYKEDKGGTGIIGHFGLGFYSAFMVSDSVDISTLSYRDGAKSAFWSCDGGTEYELKDGDRDKRGTDITLHITKEDKDLLDAFKLKEILHKYCAFLPVPIYFYESDAEDKGEPVNDTEPLWLKKPSKCKEEEYKEFYHKVFADYQEPLFWVHLNVDFPFNLKGILYFPRLSHELEAREGEVKLYNNQVFVADNIKEVIPEYLLLLKGVIDCPDLPLNVSRSFLQNDATVRKISDHIVKKVADKLTGLYKKERDNYNKYWDDINPFIKYGCMKDDKFYEKVKEILVFKTTKDRYVTLEEYTSDNKDTKEIYYATSEAMQAQYLNLFKEQDIEVIILPMMLDTHFIGFMEMKHPELKFKRIDSGAPDSLKGEASPEVDLEALKKPFADTLGDAVELEVQALKSDEIPAIIIVDEQSRRMKDMSAMYGMPSFQMPMKGKLLLNANNPLIQRAAALEGEDAKTVCEQVYDLARLSNEPLPPEEMTKFIQRSSKVLELLTNK